jgi:hypothetical protein
MQVAIIRQFEDLRMMVSTAIRDNIISGFQGVRMLEQLNATQYAFEQAMIQDVRQ